MPLHPQSMEVVGIPARYLFYLLTHSLPSDHQLAFGHVTFKNTRENLLCLQSAGWNDKGSSPILRATRYAESVNTIQRIEQESLLLLEVNL